MRPNKKQTTPVHAQVRSLKIQPHFRRNRWSKTKIPVIRLSGVWLNKLGFEPQGHVTITAKNKLLVIRLAE